MHKNQGENTHMKSKPS